MRSIKISERLKEKWGKAALGCIECQVQVKPSSQELREKLDEIITQLQESLVIEEIKTQPAIAQTRACCKALGKDVKRYRNSAEAMYRRVLQGKGIYYINNIVEVNSLISLTTGYSTGTYDLSQVKGDICWDVAEEGVHYPGIRKAPVNIGHLPALRDEESFFGNPNSDSERTCVTEDTHHILMCIYGFDGAEPLKNILEKTAEALQKYCKASDMEISIKD